MDYFMKKAALGKNSIVADDMFLTKDMPTTAGSKMLDGYMSLFDAEVIAKLSSAGYAIAGKAAVGEFAIDLLGETSFKGILEEDGFLLEAASEIIKSGDARAALVLDVNGAPRRAAVQNSLVNVKPTYGTVSRYGTVGVACSGETVGVTAKSAADCREILAVIAGHDDKDGTSLPEETCALVKQSGDTVKKIAFLTDLCDKADKEVQDKIENAAALLKESGIEIDRIESGAIASSRIAWNILMSAEACNNVSRYDGVKYGYRTQNFTNIDELYTGSRTEAFGDLIKTCILFGSETLSTDNYMKVYDKALRSRRVIVETFNTLFEKYDAVLLPAASQMKYSVEQVKATPSISYEENLFTAPASVTGLPAVTAGGVQFIGKAFTEGRLLSLAEIMEKEGEVR